MRQGSVGARPKAPTTIAPGQPAPSSRQKDKFVPLPSFHSVPDLLEDPTQLQQPIPIHEHEQYTPSIFEDLPTSVPIQQTNRRGRVGI